MPKQLVLTCAGLWTAPNRYSGVPDGAMSEADNVVIKHKGLAQIRKGYQPIGTSPDFGSIGYASSQYVWKPSASGSSFVVVYNLDEGAMFYRNSNFEASSWGSVTGTYAPASGEFMRFAEAKKCLYFASDDGVMRIDTSSGTLAPILSGIPKPLSILASDGGASGFLDDGFGVAYRAVIKFTDAAGNVYLSAPSSRAVFRSTSNDRQVAVKVYLPTGLSTSYSVQIYRSASLESDTLEPSDEMGLVYERPITSGEITAGAFDITGDDIVADESRGASAYFSPSQEGILNSNDRPPLAEDIAWHKGMMFYANTLSKHRLTLRMLALPTANDTITLAGTAYTAKASAGSTSEFSIASGSSSPQVNIQQTTINLVNAINTNTGNTSIYAYYLSGPDDGAGIFMLEERGVGGSSFPAIASVAATWVPQLPASGTTVSSANDDSPGRLYFSKSGQPEAVPLLNYIDVGSVTDPIKRIMPLRDMLFVFKASEGIWRITGSGPGQLATQMVDPTIELSAPNTLQSIGNRLFCVTPKGAMAIDESGSQPLSRPIADIVRSWHEGSQGASIHNIHAAKHEVDGLFIIFPATGGAFTQAYVLSVDTGAWTRWVISCRSAVWDQYQRRLVFGPEDNTLWYERTAGTDADFQDNTGAIPVALTWTAHVAGAPASFKSWNRVDFLSQGSTIEAMTAGYKTEIDTSEETVSLALTSGQATIASPIPQAKQLGAQLTVSLDASVASKKTAIAGLAITYSEQTEMGGR